MAEYDVGQAITDTWTFRNSTGAATDPTTATFTVLNPDGTTTTLTGTHTATGTYTTTFTPTTHGTFVPRAVGTGAVADSEQVVHVVRPVYTWDPLAILTLDEAKRAIGMTTSDMSRDTLLVSYVAAVSRALDDNCGPVVIRTITDEVHNGAGGIVRPRYTPVSSVTTVTEYANTTATTLTAETNTTKPSDAYLLINDGLHGVRLMRRSNNGDAFFTSGSSNVVITYVAGRYATTAAVDPKFKLAASIMLAQLWRPEQGSGNVTFGGIETPSGGAIPTFAIPNAVRQLLGRELIDVTPLVA